MNIPLFPLSSIVLPGGRLPLRLFEPRYIRMVSECMKKESGFGICLSRPQDSSDLDVQPYPIGTVARVVDFDQGSDGLLHITVLGEQEFTVASFNAESDGLLVGEVELQNRPETSPMPSAYSGLAVKLSQILDHLEPHISFPDRDLDDAEWVCNRLLELLPIEADHKYEMLSSFDTGSRLKALDEMAFTIAEED